jgi:hypothetical protein
MIGTAKESRNGFFLYGWVSDPNAIIIHNHHYVSLLCPYGNDLAIMIRTDCSMLRWNTRYNREPSSAEENDQHRFFAHIVCRIFWGISWPSGDQNPVRKLSHIIHDSSPVQKFNQFRRCPLTNEISRNFVIDTRFFVSSSDREWGIHFQCWNFKRSTNLWTSNTLDGE